MLTEPVTVRVRHAMFTGPEMSMQLPPEPYAALLGVPQEAAVIMPVVGQVLFTVLPTHVWPGSTAPIIDLGVYYGPYGRTFFPSGWLPGNAFATVIPDDHDAMRRTGRALLDTGAQDVLLQIR